jgi:isocitrate/isopropylmalate dehydrogenase
MRARIAYLPGDGVGPEVLAVARRVLEAAGIHAEWDERPVGWAEWCRSGEPLPASTLEACRRADAILFGAITSQPDVEAEAALAPELRGRGLRYASPILRLRRELDLGVNIRPVHAWPGNPLNLRDDVDLVIFRENTEGLYAGIEAHPFGPELRAAWAQMGATRLPPAGPDTAVSLRVVTRRATERLAEAAFAYAHRNGRRRVTLVEKPNVLRVSGGFVRRIFFEVAARYPTIATDELHVDAACAALVRRPHTFDVMVATNLFGDILSDVAAEVAGGLPLAASANVGERHALFEPVHGSAPDVAGRGTANPLGAVLAGALLARHVGQGDVAARVEAAVARLLAEGAARPVDLGGHARTADVESALVAVLQRPPLATRQ